MPIFKKKNPKPEDVKPEPSKVQLGPDALKKVNGGLFLGSAIKQPTDTSEDTKSKI